MEGDGFRASAEEEPGHVNRRACILWRLLLLPLAMRIREKLRTCELFMGHGGYGVLGGDDIDAFAQNT